MKEILAFLKESDGEATFGQVYGKLALKYGTTKRTFWDYVHALEYAGEIEEIGLYVTANEKNVPIRLKRKKVK